MLGNHMGYLLIGGTSLIGGWIGSFLAAYLKKKGENLATHEDIGKLVEQMKAITEATKTIESEISDKSWDRQRLWELKRDSVFTVIQALGKADETLHFVSVAILAQRDLEAPDGLQAATLEAWGKFYTAIDDFDQKRALALIVCGKEMNDALIALRTELRGLGFQLGEGTIESYEAYSTPLGPLFARAFACARKELGILRQNESS
jgi:hypothetical protein